MGSVCYSCKRKIGVFQSRGSINFITSQGYKPLEGMTKKDSICQSCLNEIKRTQIRDKKVLRIGVAGQIVLCLIPFFHYILQAYSFYRINKLRKFLVYFTIIHAAAIGMFIVGIENKELEILFYMGIAGFVGGYFIPVIWVIDWTRAYNENPT